MIDTTNIQGTVNTMMGKGASSISIVIPAYNEGMNIGVVLGDLLRNMEGLLLPTEIIVVDDGSRDDTNDIAAEYGVRIVNNVKNLGKTRALLNGIAETSGSLIVTMDADGSHLAKDIPSLIEPVLSDEADFTIGSRFVNDEGKKSTTRVHLIGNWIINTAIYLMTGKRVSDSQSGFRAYRREVLNSIAIKSMNFEIEAEITIRLIMHGFRHRDVPIDCMPRLSGKTNLRTFRDGAAILFTVFRTAAEEYYRKLVRGK